MKRIGVVNVTHWSSHRGPLVDKEMIVQVTNRGDDLRNNHFDIQIPGGGFGIFDKACPTQFSGFAWGAQYGGVGQRAACANLPPPLRAGCYWRFDWFKNANNPNVSFRRVACPVALTNKSKCIRR